LYLERYVSADCISLTASLDATQVYRCFYYIEKICFFLRREGTMDKRLNRILKYVNAFTCYEAHLLDSASDHIRNNRHERYTGNSID